MKPIKKLNNHIEEYAKEVEQLFGALPELTGPQSHLWEAKEIRLSALHEVAQMIKRGKIKRYDMRVMRLADERQIHWWMQRQNYTAREFLIAAM